MATITKRENGRYQAKIRKGGVIRSKTFHRRSDAKSWAQRIEAQIELGIVDHEEQLFYLEDVVNRYIKEITPRKKSYKVEIYTLGNVTRELGHIPMQQLKAEDIVSYIDKRLKTVKPATVNKELNKLSHIIDTAKILWHVSSQDNPVKTAKKILSFTQTLNIDEHRTRRITKAEEDLLCDPTRSGKVSKAIMFALDTAMRRGEIAAMRPEHLAKNILSIPETKTGKSRRIPLTSRALKIFKKSDGCLYPRAETITKAFQEVCLKHGIKDLRFHDLRHEATSRLFEKGLSIEEVASITGHDSWESLKRYTHIKPENVAKKI